MNKILSVVFMLVLTGMLVGCGATASKIGRLTQSQHLEVFSEISGSGEVPPGFVDLILRANIKTHVEGYYAFESKDSLHGKPGYPFLLNIDGQAVVWRVEGERETTPLYDERGKISNNPEAGDGVRYVLEKTIRLAVGTRVLFLGLPEENYYTKADVTLKPGETYVLEFKPRYRYKTLPTRIPTFLKGLDEYEIVLNRKSD